MLPSGITAPAESAARSSSLGGTLLLRRSGDAGTVADTRLIARGPLARRALQLLGIGPTGQAFRSWASPSLGAAFPGEAVATGWLAARSLPTPNGYYRSTLRGSWIL